MPASMAALPLPPEPSACYRDHPPPEMTDYRARETFRGGERRRVRETRLRFLISSFFLLVAFSGDKPGETKRQRHGRAAAETKVELFVVTSS